MSDHSILSRINPRLLAAAEVGVFYFLALLLIWTAGAYRPPILLVAIIFIGICVGSNRLHGDSLDKIGLRGKNFLPALKRLLPLAIPLMGIIIWMGRGDWTRPGWDMWFVFLGYPFWGFAQEYVLLGFVGNRLMDVFPNRPTAAAGINAVLFSLAHLPNPYLMSATFLAGFIFTFVYYRHRDLYAPSLIHALFGILLSLSLSGIPGAMMVGPGYLNRTAAPISYNTHP